MLTNAPSFPDKADAPARCYALIPCAGSGSRAGRAQPKQYQSIAGARLIDHTVDAFLGVPALAGVGVVVAPDDVVYTSPHARVRVWHVGGATRAHSVFNGLLALQGAGARPHDWVLVHDAARCLVRPAEVDALIQACINDTVGGLLAVPVPDTLKRADCNGRAEQTVDRVDIWQAQTPQMFRVSTLWSALEAQSADGFAGITDEASAVERNGLTPLLVRGSAQNFKVTYPEDFALAEAVLQSRRTTKQREDTK